MRSIIRTGALCALLACAAGAAAKGPDPAPAPKPEAPAIDRSTPKGALLEVYTACIAGDRAKLSSLVHPATPNDQKGADVIVDLILAETQWVQALSSKFAGDPFIHAGAGTALYPRSMETVIASAETTSADKATVTLPNGPAIPMCRGGAGWHLSSNDVLDPAAKGGSLDAAITATAAKVQAYASTSAEVAVGTYPNAQAAHLAFQKKLGIAPAPPPAAKP